MLPATTPLPVVTPSPPLAPNAVELAIGEATASAAIAVARALQTWHLTSHRDGWAAAEQIERLFGLWHEHLGEVDFAAAANIYGRSALRARCGGALNDKLENELIGFVLDTLRKTVEVAMN